MWLSAVVRVTSTRTSPSGRLNFTALSRRFHQRLLKVDPIAEDGNVFDTATNELDPADAHLRFHSAQGGFDCCPDRKVLWNCTGKQKPQSNPAGRGITLRSLHLAIASFNSTKFNKRVTPAQSIPFTIASLACVVMRVRWRLISSTFRGREK
jgi:hypothetical protein